MSFPPTQVVFGLLILSNSVVFIWDIKYNPFGEDEEGILQMGFNPQRKI